MPTTVEKAHDWGAVLWRLTWEHEDQQLEVKVERGPGSRLVLTDGGDDGDVVLGIGRIEKGVEPTRPRGDLWEGKGCGQGKRAQTTLCVLSWQLQHL